MYILYISSMTACTLPIPTMRTRILFSPAQTWMALSCTVLSTAASVKSCTLRASPSYRSPPSAASPHTSWKAGVAGLQGATACMAGLRPHALPLYTRWDGTCKDLHFPGSAPL